jgi:hypothetical protein
MRIEMARLKKRDAVIQANPQSRMISPAKDVMCMEITNLSTLNALVAVRGNICHAGLQQADVDVEPAFRQVAEKPTLRPCASFRSRLATTRPRKRL